MFSKLEDLLEFYNAIDFSRVKIESKKSDIGYWNRLDAAAGLNYVEFSKNVCKYRMSGLSHEDFTYFLKQHIDKEINLCVYFNPEKNNLFAFNLDSVDPQINSIKIYALYVFKTLLSCDIFPLIIKSGHGYHFWGRINGLMENSRLRMFISAVSRRAFSLTAEQGVDMSVLRSILYPRSDTGDISIRMFGGKHMITGEFSHVVTRIDEKDTVLDEKESWDYFHQYIDECTVPADNLNKICGQL